MNDAVGYANYQDPRLQPPPEPEVDTCNDCAFFREACERQVANGYVHSIGMCVLEVFEARTLDELYTAELAEVGPNDEACADFEEVE